MHIYNQVGNDKNARYEAISLLHYTITVLVHLFSSVECLDLLAHLWFYFHRALRNKSVCPVTQMFIN